jgi:hypothetical protein
VLSVAAKKLKVEADNMNRATDNSSYHAKSEFNNCFIIYSKDIKTFQYSFNIFDKFFMSLSLKKFQGLLSLCGFYLVFNFKVS